jgi:hypothetical protein
MGRRCCFLERGVGLPTSACQYRLVTDGPSSSPTAAEIAKAWTRVVTDCGCPDLYYCPAVDDIECPRHSGFDVCCDREAEHVSVR